MEEIDFSWRLKQAGYKVICVPQSAVFHMGGGSLQMGNPRKTYFNFRNNLIMLMKNLKLSELLWKLPIRLALDDIAILRFLLRTELLHAWAVLKAHTSFFLGIHKWVRQRNRIQKNLKNSFPQVSSLTGVYHRSVVWQHFVRGINTFSHLDIHMTPYIAPARKKELPAAAKKKKKAA